FLLTISPSTNSPLFPYTTLFRSRDAAVSLDDAVGTRPRPKCRGRRSAHPQEGRVLRSADHQRDRTVEFRAHQSGSIARNAGVQRDRKSTRLNSSHEWISYAVFCL